MNLSRKVLVQAFLWALAALVLRAGYTAVMVHRYGTAQLTDFLYLHQLAASLAAGQGFTLDGVRIFNQSAGYPLFLAPFYRLFGSTPLVAMALNMVLGAVSVGLVYLFARRLFPEGVPSRGLKRPSVIAAGAALAAACYPDSLLYAPIVAAENLLTPLLLLMAMAVVTDWRRDWVGGAVVGLLAAAAASVKAVVLFACLLLPVVWLLRDRRAAVRTLAAALVGGVCLLPWTLVNYRASGGPILPFAAVAGSAFLDGTNPRARGEPTMHSSSAEAGEGPLSEIERNSRRMKEALGYIRDRPAWYVGLLGRKLVLSFSPKRDFIFQWNEQSRLFIPFLSRWIPTLFNAFLLAGVALALVFLRRERPAWLITLWLVAASVLIQLVFFAYSRYRFPFLFALIPSAVAGWLALAGSWRGMPAPDRAGGERSGAA